MTADEKRKQVVKAYKSIIGRNKYSKQLRDYCMTPYSDGCFYSDCSSSICYCYKASGIGINIMNTVGMFTSSRLTTVDVVIKNGQIVNTDVLRVGDILLFAGTDLSRWYAQCVGHAEMVADIDVSGVILYGHGSGVPTAKDMKAPCRSRYNAKTKTPIGNKGIVKVVRIINDGDTFV